MEIKENGFKDFRDKFIHKAKIGDVIKVHYSREDLPNTLLLIYVRGQFYLFDLKENVIIDYVGNSLRELYKDAFTLRGEELIYSLEVYKDSVLTVK